MEFSVVGHDLTHHAYAMKLWTPELSRASGKAEKALQFHDRSWKCGISPQRTQILPCASLSFGSS